MCLILKTEAKGKWLLLQNAHEKTSCSTQYEHYTFVNAVNAVGHFQIGSIHTLVLVLNKK